jgi:small subunit ribosomal protein S21
MKLKQHFEKPSEKNAQQKAEAIRRARSGPQSGVSRGPRELIGSGSPLDRPCWLFRLGRHDRLHLGDGLKLGQELRTRLH